MTIPGSLTIRNAMIFDGESPDLIVGSISIRDGRITAVGREVEETGAVLDSGGRT